MPAFISSPLQISAKLRRSFKSRLALAALALALGTGSAAVADPKPSQAKAISAQVMANKFAGRTHVWKSCKGGVYFGSNWEAVAYCGKHKNSVGVGQWSTQGGKLCRKITWYFVKGGQLQSKPEEVKCDLQMVTDQDGQFWHNWQNDSDWWRGYPKDKSFPKGNKHKRQINKLRQKYGV